MPGSPSILCQMNPIWGQGFKCGVAAAVRGDTKDVNSASSHRSIWQRGFFHHFIRNTESYAQKRDYVRENPVGAGLVKARIGISRIKLRRSIKPERIKRERSCSAARDGGSYNASQTCDLAGHPSQPTGPKKSSVNTDLLLCCRTDTR